MPHRRGLRGIFNSSHRGTVAAVGLLFILISVACLSYFAFGSTAHAPNNSLSLVCVLFRHGDRTRRGTYPNDPYKDPKYWPEGLGALTTKGKLAAYNLGVYLRERYSTFLPDLYSPDDFYIVSSDSDRCLMSAYLCVAGLYPPRGWQIWSDDIKWQPIPVHATPIHLDHMIALQKPCPKYDKELSAVRNSTVFSPDDAELLNYLTIHSGKKIDMNSAEFLYNTLEIEDKMGLSLPSWTKTIYPQPLLDLATRSVASFTETQILKRLRGGPMLKDMVTHMVDKVAGNLTPDRRLFMYSGHDHNIVAFLRALGVPDLLKPDPTAAVIVELHREENGGPHYVKVLYKENEATKSLRALEVTGCEEHCLFEDFVDLTKDSIPINWDEECQL